MLYNFCIMDAQGLEADNLLKAFEKAIKEKRAVPLLRGHTKTATKTIKAKSKTKKTAVR